MTLRMLAATAALGVALVVTGCVPSEPVITPVETGATVPIFATDEEALAAAVAAFDGYTEVTSQIRIDGGEDADRVAEHVSADLLAVELEAFEKFREQGIRFIGTVSYSEEQLQQHWQDGSWANVVAYFCEDASSYLIARADGTTFRPENVPEKTIVEVSFVSKKQLSPTLVVTGVAPWGQPGSC